MPYFCMTGEWGSLSLRSPGPYPGPGPEAMCHEADFTWWQGPGTELGEEVAGTISNLKLGLEEEEDLPIHSNLTSQVL